MQSEIVKYSLNGPLSLLRPESYNKEATDDSWDKVKEWLRKYLI